ncbi:hypothetical protein AKJ42_00665 [candidate division MSBL1 archaeon SCGC-AAA261C02]|uniref:Glyceraldehyde 3-phosphate phosphatase n=1 Tax=candidate division MSBL1 archaeon SCGC-AAA261C02 TaxID=1698272 RepID=A0A133V214_9EURY|nr:hypothetical protein AKJ42_00665 [candidate division MSBL1 archaeon SCGC-AAA261C02]
MTNKLTNVKAILFDLDETLIDALTGLRAAHKAVSEKVVDYFPSKLSNHDIGVLQRKLLELDDEMNLQTHYDRDEWWPEFLDRIGVDHELESSQIKELSQVYWSTYIQTAKPCENAKPTLEYLRKRDLALGIVTDTDSSGESKKRRIAKLDFTNYLDIIIVGGEDTEQTKPSPEPFKLAAKKLGLKPSECAMIGDKPFTDIKGAKTAGMKTILLERREWNSEETPDLTINSLEELQNLF